MTAGVRVPACLTASSLRGAPAAPKNMSDMNPLYLSVVITNVAAYTNANEFMLYLNSIIDGAEARHRKGTPQADELLRMRPLWDGVMSDMKADLAGAGRGVRETANAAREKDKSALARATELVSRPRAAVMAAVAVRKTEERKAAKAALLARPAAAAAAAAAEAAAAGTDGAAMGEEGAGGGQEMLSVDVDAENEFQRKREKRASVLKQVAESKRARAMPAPPARACRHRDHRRLSRPCRWLGSHY